MDDFTTSFDINIQSDEQSLPSWLLTLLDPEADDDEIDKAMNCFL